MNISARSMGAVNVQVILETLGGGGHLTMAGAQLKGVNQDEARRRFRTRCAPSARSRRKGAKQRRPDGMNPPDVRAGHSIRKYAILLKIAPAERGAEHKRPPGACRGAKRNIEVTDMKVILKQDVKSLGKRMRSMRCRTVTPATSCSPRPGR